MSEQFNVCKKCGQPLSENSRKRGICRSCLRKKAGKAQRALGGVGVFGAGLGALWKSGVPQKIISLIKKA